MEKDPKSSIEKTEGQPAGEKKTPEEEAGAAEKTGEAKTPELVTKTEAEKTDAAAEAKTETKTETPAEKSPPAE